MWRGSRSRKMKKFVACIIFNHCSSTSHLNIPDERWSWHRRYGGRLPHVDSNLSVDFNRFKNCGRLFSTCGDQSPLPARLVPTHRWATIFICGDSSPQVWIQFKPSGRREATCGENSPDVLICPKGGKLSPSVGIIPHVLWENVYHRV